MGRRRLHRDLLGFLIDMMFALCMPVLMAMLPIPIVLFVATTPSFHVACFSSVWAIMCMRLPLVTYMLLT